MIAKQTRDLEIAEKSSCPTALDKLNVVVIVTVCACSMPCRRPT